jgi:hypothetical protein
MSAAAQLFTTVGCFGLAEQREIVLEVSRTMTAFAACQIVFEIGVTRTDRGERFD